MSEGMGERPRPAGLAWKDPALIEALSVAMILAPGVYARNRMFELMSTEGARRARSRSRTVLGMIPHLAKADVIHVHPASSGGFVVRYAITSMRFTRVVELSAVELAALAMALAKLGVDCPRPHGVGPELVTRALALLMQSGAPEGLRDLCRE